jgi:hypothetical protein
MENHAPEGMETQTRKRHGKSKHHSRENENGNSSQNQSPYPSARSITPHDTKSKPATQEHNKDQQPRNTMPTQGTPTSDSASNQTTDGNATTHSGMK